MIQRGEDLPLVPESLQYKGRIQTNPHQFYCHLFVILTVRADSTIHFAHPSMADFRNDLIDTDFEADSAWVMAMLRQYTSNIGDWILQEDAAGLFVGMQERLELAAKLRIIAAD